MPLPQLKTQSWGQGPPRYPMDVCHSLHGMRNKSDDTWKPEREKALKDYRTHRENGGLAENPSRVFPHDGCYSFQMGRGSNRNTKEYVTYTEGPGDKKWMKEKDRNYIDRLRNEDLDTLKAMVEVDSIVAAIFKDLEIISIKQFIEGNNLSQVRTFYMNKRKFTITDDEGRTPLHWAASQGRDKILEWLLSNQKIDIDAPSRKGLTPLHEAIGKGHEKCLFLLLQHRAKTTIKANGSEALLPLHMAVLNGETLMVEHLLSAEDLHLEEKTGAHYKKASALHLAAITGNAIILNILINAGVDTKAINMHGRTALHIAAYYGKAATMRALLTRDPELRNEVDNKMQTALHAAVVGNQEQAIGVLLDAGLYPGLKDKDGLTAEELAEKLGHIKLVQYFQQREHDQKNRPAQFDMQAMFAQFQQLMLAQQAPISRNPPPSEYAGSIHSMSGVGSSIGDERVGMMHRFFETMQHPPSTSIAPPAAGGAIEIDTPPSSGPATPR